MAGGNRRSDGVNGNAVTATTEETRLDRLRDAGQARWEATGVPGSRDEEWRFTPVAPIGKVDWRTPGPTPEMDPAAIAEFGIDPSWPTVTLVDGRFDPSRSNLEGIPDGVTVLPLRGAIAAQHPTVLEKLGATADAEQTPFTALSLARFEDGVFIEVPAGVTVAQPIHLLQVSTAAASDALIAPRALIVVDADAAATVIESYRSLSGEQHFTNTVVEVHLGRNARLEQIRIQCENEATWHIGFTQIDQQRDSHYRSFALSMGGRLARHNIHARHHGTAVETLLYGLYLTRGTQLADTHSAIFHDQPNCNSWEVYKGVLADESRAVFNGKVLVDSIAQKTDAKQTNRNLLLSDKAKVDTKPQLEIFADDVKCTHGATVGRLNEQQRYYLKSRGIGGRKAEQLLIWAFAAEVIAEVLQPVVRAELERMVHARLDELTA
ncbi:MAG TPA: Fe-S cluster assembly protein SufD [Gemmatimonadales bacterium]|nr:Fe-S cluster assembly protein SufD [Gemmatimonadales bacterium]